MRELSLALRVRDFDDAKEKEFGTGGRAGGIHFRFARPSRRRSHAFELRNDAEMRAARQRQTRIQPWWRNELPVIPPPPSAASTPPAGSLHPPLSLIHQSNHSSFSASEHQLCFTISTRAREGCCYIHRREERFFPALSPGKEGKRTLATEWRDKCGVRGEREGERECCVSPWVTLDGRKHRAPAPVRVRPLARDPSLSPLLFVLTSRADSLLTDRPTDRRTDKPTDRLTR